MKRYFIISLSAMLALCSCEDFLTRENPNKIESETYFTNAASLKIYANGLGRSFAPLILAFSSEDIGTDILFQEGTNLYYTSSYTAESASNWRASHWSKLRNINFFLDNTEIVRKGKEAGAELPQMQCFGKTADRSDYGKSCRRIESVISFNFTERLMSNRIKATVVMAFIF